MKEPEFTVYCSVTQAEKRCEYTILHPHGSLGRSERSVNYYYNAFLSADYTKMCVSVKKEKIVITYCFGSYSRKAYKFRNNGIKI